MKRYIIFILLLSAYSLSAQTVWVANNNFNAPTGPNVFSTVQAAVNAAMDGDIVQVQPSPNTYGSVVIEKQITLMGIGFNVDKDIPLTSVMTNITLRNNADNTSDADGTIIKGLDFATLILANNGSNPQFTLENVLIQNCQFGTVQTSTGTSYSDIDGLEIRDCFIDSNSSGFAIYFYKNTTNVIIRNNLVLHDIGFFDASPGSNIITNNLLYGGVRVDAEGSNTTILNNNFIGQTGNENGFASELRDCIVVNNIFFGTTPSLVAAGNSNSVFFQRNVFTNNLVFSTGDDVMPPSGGGAGNSGSGNLVGTPSFVNAQLLNNWSSTYDFTLQGGSIAINAGTDGTDIGMTGGSYPFPGPNFELGTTPAPVIQILNTSTVINPGDDLPVRIKANSN